jgi:lipid-A-disaccharide synthase
LGNFSAETHGAGGSQADAASRSLRIAMVAGEASGDLLAAHLIDALKQRFPNAHFTGIGGARMQAAGFEAWWPSEKLAVRGYVEVLRHYREISGIRSELAERLLNEKPDLFIGVDAPDFNLDLEIRLREAGIKTCHFVSPSVWAWRGGRMEKIRRAAGHMLCLFPFEEKLYADAGIAATYVGHPLADVIPAQPDRAAARTALKLPQDATVIALLPGSRQSELKYLGERFARAALSMQSAVRHATAQPAPMHFVVPLASSETEALWRTAVSNAGASQVPITIAPRGTHDALAACDLAIVASGTATLETALFQRPMVIAYNMAPTSWALMRRMRYQLWVGLPNILCGEFVVPELLQDDATPDNLAQAALNLQLDQAACARIRARFAVLHAQLRQGMAARAGEAVAHLLAE